MNEKGVETSQKDVTNYAPLQLLICSSDPFLFNTIIFCLYL